MDVITHYLMIFSCPLAYFMYKFFNNTKIVNLKDCDLVSGHVNYINSVVAGKNDHKSDHAYECNLEIPKKGYLV